MSSFIFLIILCFLFKIQVDKEGRIVDAKFKTFEQFVFSLDKKVANEFLMRQACRHGQKRRG